MMLRNIKICNSNVEGERKKYLMFFNHNLLIKNASVGLAVTALFFQVSLAIVFFTCMGNFRMIIH